MATCIGQTFKMTLEITQEKGGSEEMVDVTVSLPHHMDGIAINLPAYMAGLPEEAYLSEFQVAPEVVEEESESSSMKSVRSEFRQKGYLQIYNCYITVI